MALQSARSLLTSRGAGHDVDSWPHTPPDDFTSPISASRYQHVELKQLQQRRFASAVNLDTFSNAPSPQLGDSKHASAFSAWAKKLLPFPKRKPEFHHPQHFSSCSALAQNGLSIMPSTMVPRKPVRRSYSYTKGDDRAMSARVSNEPSPAPQSALKEMELLESKPPVDSLRIPFTADKSFEIIGSPVFPSTREAGPNWKDTEQPSPPNNEPHRAIYAYQVNEPGFLSFDESEVLLISRKEDDGWWYAKRQLTDEAGWVPSSFLDIRPIPEIIFKCVPRRTPAIRQKRSVKRRAIYGIAELETGEDMQFYRHITHQLLSVRECAVCGDMKSLTDFPEEWRLQCKHVFHTCRECVQAWIAAELESKRWDHITCPEEECKASLCYADISQLADDATFQRYDTLATRAHLSKLPNFRWCLSSTCESGQIHEDAFGPIFKCTGCGMQSCTQHGIPWHHGETCNEYDQRVSREKQDKEEQATRKMLKKMAKTCPGKACGWMIEKRNGCDHMTCRQCRHEFCWVCLAPYDPIRRYGNGKHRRSCKYHTNNVE